MLSELIEVLVEGALYVWPTGEKRWWKLGLWLAVCVVAAVVIGVMLSD
jgi:hypothetical protein